MRDCSGANLEPKRILFEITTHLERQEDLDAISSCEGQVVDLVAQEVKNPSNEPTPDGTNDRYLRWFETAVFSLVFHFLCNLFQRRTVRAFQVETTIVGSLTERKENSKTYGSVKDCSCYGK